MKFKILLLAFAFMWQNLYPFEPLTPSKASKRAEELGQLDWIINSTNDYGSESKPSFACYNTKGKYKFKKYSLEDFICQSSYNSFRDNYFADLYNLIVKENPNLKDKAQKIARERIKATRKECMIYSQKDYISSIEDYPNPDAGPGYIRDRRLLAGVDEIAVANHLELVRVSSLFARIAPFLFRTSSTFLPS